MITVAADDEVARDLVPDAILAIADPWVVAMKVMEGDILRFVLVA